MRRTPSARPSAWIPAPRSRFSSCLHSHAHLVPRQINFSGFPVTRPIFGHRSPSMRPPTRHGLESPPHGRGHGRGTLARANVFHEARSFPPSRRRPRAPYLLPVIGGEEEKAAGGPQDASLRGRGWTSTPRKGRSRRNSPAPAGGPSPSASLLRCRRLSSPGLDPAPLAGKVSRVAVGTRNLRERLSRPPTPRRRLAAPAEVARAGGLGEPLEGRPAAWAGLAFAVVDPEGVLRSGLLQV